MTYNRKLRFIHSSDLHLGRPFTGISQKAPDIADYLSKASSAAFDNIIASCIMQNVDLLLISGDVFDSEEKNLRSVLNFLKGVRKLSENNIPTFVSPGNHDPCPAWEYVKRLTGDDLLLTIFPSDNISSTDITQYGETIARLYGIGHARSNITENLAIKFPKREDLSVPAIGMLHCNVGSIAGQENYSPCTISDLKSSGYDYWALGHIHTRIEIRKEEPLIIYAGDPQGTSSKETGPKGCILVSIETSGEITWEFIETDIIRWENVEINISGLDTETGLIEVIENEMNLITSSDPGRSYIFSIVLTGSGPLHNGIILPSVIETILESLQTTQGDPPFLYIADIINKTTIPLNREELRDNPGLTGEVIDVTDSLLEEPDLKTIDEILRPLLHHRIMQGIKPGPISKEEKISLVKRAESLLLQKMQVDNED